MPARNPRHRTPPGSSHITFKVEYPWGAGWVDGLMVAFKKLGIAVAENPLADSDTVGLLAAADQATLDKGLKFLNEAMENDVELQDDNEAVVFGWLSDMYLLRLPKMGVHGSEHDWNNLQLDQVDRFMGKDLDRLDVKLDYFEDLGVEVRLRSVTQPGDVMKFEMWKKASRRFSILV